MNEDMSPKKMDGTLDVKKYSYETLMSLKRSSTIGLMARESKFTYRPTRNKALSLSPSSFLEISKSGVVWKPISRHYHNVVAVEEDHPEEL